MAQTDGYNSDIKSEQVQKLAELFPEAVVEGRVNFDTLKAVLGEGIEYGEKYGLGWKGKSGVFAKIQEKTVSTLHPQPDESVDWDTTQNMFIEGDNLEVLKVLHKAYYGKIKMIYIDPPYNTGNDFVYNDDFAKTRRQNAMDEGLLDEEGNVTRDDGLRVNTGGHKHSNWLDMMYPRLFLGRNLLRQDGVIFVSIDDNEVHNLRLIMDEIFGAENFIAQLIHQRAKGGGQAKYVVKGHDYVLCYGRNLNEQVSLGRKKVVQQKTVEKNGVTYIKNDDVLRKTFGKYDKSLGDRRCAYEEILEYKGEEKKAEIDEKLAKGELFLETVAENRHILYELVPLSEATSKLYSIIKVLSEKGIEDLTALGVESWFSYPKPVEFVKTLIDAATISDKSEAPIVLDFFGGSGTFAQAVSELNASDGGNRRWICVQLPEQIDEGNEAYQAGYKTIAEIARERIRRANIKTGKDFANTTMEREPPFDLGFRSYVLGDSNFKKWNELMYDASEIRQATLDQLSPIEDGASDNDLLIEILLKRGISPLVEMEKHEDFIFIPSETLAISLSRHMAEVLFAKILAASPSQIILLDQAFRDDMNLKTNLILQAEKQNIVVEIL